MKTKITFKNISNFIEGNTKLFLSKISLTPKHIQEQVAYRSLLCQNTCVINGKCEFCNCDLPGKFFVKESCNNGIKFPDLMNKVEWEKFKNENGIE